MTLLIRSHIRTRTQVNGTGLYTGAR